MTAVREFQAYVKAFAPPYADEDLGIRVMDAVEGTRILGPCVGQNPLENTVDITCSVVAVGPKQALEIGIEQLFSALGYTPGVDDDRLISVEVSPDDELDRDEVVSQAEIARRLGVSRARVHQLVKHADFPAPAQRNGPRAYLYRWTDVLDWQNQRISRSTTMDTAARHQRAARRPRRLRAQSQ